MQRKKMLSKVFVSMVSMSLCAGSSLVAMDADDFFRCAFLSRAEVAVNKASKGELSPEDVEQFTSEDRAKVVTGIHARVAVLQSDLLTDAQKNGQKAGTYAAQATVLAGLAASAYGFTNLSLDCIEWMICSRRAHALQVLGLPGFEAESHLAQAFGSNAKKSALICAGACAVWGAGVCGFWYAQGLASAHDAAATEIENLNASLELIEATPGVEVSSDVEVTVE